MAKRTNSYWASMTPAERKAENARRYQVRLRNRGEGRIETPLTIADLIEDDLSTLEQQLIEALDRKVNEIASIQQQLDEANKVTKRLEKFLQALRDENNRVRLIDAEENRIVNRLG